MPAIIPVLRVYSKKPDAILQTMTTHYWIFDLDNTLHYADAGIFNVINQNMTHFLASQLHIDQIAASQLRQQYWDDYGATLIGIGLHHPEINLHEFLLACHPLEKLLPLLKPMPELSQTLTYLHGHKIVFSNGPSHYVQALIKAMGIQQYFHAVIGTDNVEMHCKPHPHAYHSLCRQLHIHPQQCIMVDDSPANLHTAHMLGMRTVWYGPQSYPRANIDAAVTDMAGLRDIALTLL
ncbi:pyrimidine 5'-nucleotidase [Snodgrassella alvi]|uniref:pyrimidine 5'-nucleotidase n=2 Tax=Neisseriaceae TaxID=481 RepID=UPI00352E4A13